MKWQQAQLKYVTRFAYGDALPRTEDDYIREGSIQVFGSNGPFARFSVANTKAPAIIVGRKGSYGKINWTSDPCFSSDTTFFIDQTTTTHNLRWLFYVLQTLRLDEGSDEAAVPGLNRDDAYERTVLVPPLRTQRGIAAYLDRETAKIDAMIDAKQRLLALLAEKRRAMITHAVTRGLNPDAPMRDSGVSWIGEVPEGWEVPPVFTRYEVVLGKMLDEKKISGANLAPYLRNIDVQWHKVNIVDLPKMDFDSDDRLVYLLQRDDLLICEGGEIGRTAIWKDELEECYYQKALHRLRPITHNDNPYFFAYVMEAAVGIGVFAAEGNRSTIQHLTAEKLKLFRFPAPTYDDQSCIVDYIESRIVGINSLYLATEKTIGLLDERRAALIAAAVTGRIEMAGFK